MLYFFTAMALIYPLLTISYGFPHVCWLFSIIATVKFFVDGRLKRKWKDFPLKMPLTLIMLFHLIQPLFVDWRPIFMTYLYEIRYFMTTYYLIFLGYCMSSKYDDIWKNYKWIYLLSSIVIIIGFSCYAMGYNYISDNISDGNNIWTADLAFTERGFRITGTQKSPNLFGYINVALFMFILHFEQSHKKYILLLFLLLNIVFTGTRAPILGLMVAICVYYAYFKKSKLITITFIVVPLLFLSINFIDSPAIKRYVNGVEDLIMTGGENTGGSDSELRLLQLETSFGIGVEKPITGHGIGYLSEMTSENGVMYNKYYGGLAGGEGYLFWVFIDYGFIYLGLVIFFFTVLFFFLFTHRNTYSFCVPLSTALVCALMTHLLTSFPANSWEIFFPFIGLFIGVIKNK